MSQAFRWEGSKLRGPFAQLVSHRLMIPPGSFESAPFDQGTWWLQIMKKGKGWIMHVNWHNVAVRASDVRFD